MEKIKIDLIPARCRCHYRCTVCGGVDEAARVLALGHPGNIQICRECLTRGDINARLRERAAFLRAGADYVESLIGRLAVPSFEEWRREMDKAIYEDYRNEFPETPLPFLEWKKLRDEAEDLRDDIPW